MNEQLTEHEIRIRCAEIEGIPLTRPVYFFRFGDAGKPKRYSCEWYSREDAESQREACSKEHEVNELLESVENLPIPDYCNSIDAINAAVLRLSEEKQAEWIEALHGIVPRDRHSLHGNPLRWSFRLATASALARCKAYIKVHE